MMHGLVMSVVMMMVVAGVVHGLVALGHSETGHYQHENCG